CQVFLVRPRRRDREILKDATSVVDVFLQRRERYRPAAFFESLLFMSQSSIDHGEHAERRPVVWLRLHSFYLLGSSRFKSSSRPCLIFGHSRQQAFTKAVAQKNRGFVPTVIVAESDKRALGRSRVPIGQGADKPRIRDAGNSAAPLLANCINRLVERLSVSFPEKFI